MNKKLYSNRNLDSLNSDLLARKLESITPSDELIRKLYSLANDDIGSVAVLEKVRSIFQKNPQTMFLFGKRSAINETGIPESFISTLPLNNRGLDALFDGRLDTRSPDLDYICHPDEPVSAVYVWAIHINTQTAGGIALVMDQLKTPKYRDATLYCRAANKRAEKLFLSLGFKMGAKRNDRELKDVLTFERQYDLAIPNVTEPPKYEAPLYDSVTMSLQGNITVGVKVVHNISEFQEVVAVRAATYMTEHDCPYSEEFDGNDFACTHLIGYVNNQPAGCIRLRFFADFAKVERLAVLKNRRTSRLSDLLIRAAIELARKKGYKKLYGHAEKRVVKLWQRYGFVPRTEAPVYSFSGRDYLEGDLKIGRSNSYINLNDSPEIINRPEGMWHVQGCLG